jgi:hypothetical protein
MWYASHGLLAAAELKRYAQGQERINGKEK